MTDRPKQLTHDDVMRQYQAGRLWVIERAAREGRLRDVKREMQTDAAWHEHQQRAAEDDDATT